MKLRFDEAQHRYWHGDEELPSVSKIIKVGGLMPAFYGMLSPRHADLGSKTHLTCQLEDEQDLVEESVDPDILPKLTAYRKFKSDTGAVVLANEIRTYSEEFWYAGTLDKVARIGKELWLIDVKGETPVSYHPVQTIAYKIALETTHPRVSKGIRRAALYLRKTGKYLFVPHQDDDKDRLTWGTCLSAFEMETTA